jgi:DNA mismatch repair protein MutL
VVEGGKILSVSDATALSGTSVEVRSLFFNVPARRKFLKSPAKDTSDIVKTMTKLALAAPTVSFRLIVDGETMVSVRAEDGLSRIRSLLAEPFAQETYEVCIKKEGMALTGLIAHPRHARGTRAGQYLIVNGRPVHSLPISYGVKGAFGTTCEDNKHPQFALHLTMSIPKKERSVLRMMRG